MLGVVFGRLHMSFVNLLRILSSFLMSDLENGNV